MFLVLGCKYHTLICIYILSDIRRSEELSLLKPPDHSSKKKKKKDKNQPAEDIWDIDILGGGAGNAGTKKIIIYIHFITLSLLP